jgi:hypothetical protein
MAVVRNRVPASGAPAAAPALLPVAATRRAEWSAQMVRSSCKQVHFKRCMTVQQGVSVCAKTQCLECVGALLCN